MSIRVMTLVLSVKLGSTARKVIALKLADCADDDGTNVFPGVTRLAAECEVSERTVQYVLREFEDPKQLGILKIVERGGKGRRSTNEYAFDLKKLSEFPPSYSVELTKDQERRKGAKSAPLTKPLRVQPDAVKGATSDSLGCNPCTRPIIDPSKTLPRAGARKVKGSKSDLKSEVKREPLAAAREALAKAESAVGVKPTPSRPQRANWLARKGSPEFAAWLAHFEALEREDVVTELRLHGYISTVDRWPPGHEGEA